MYYLRVIILLLISLLLFSCKRDINSSVLSEKLVRPQSETLGKINIVQTGYDSLIIQNSENLILKSRSVSIIRLFKKENSKYVLTNTQIPEYSGSYGSYTMKFKFKIYVPENVLFCNFKLQFVLFDSSKVEIDTSATTCQYPYKNAEIFYTYDELPYPEEKNGGLPRILTLKVTNSIIVTRAAEFTKSMKQPEHVKLYLIMSLIITSRLRQKICIIPSILIRFTNWILLMATIQNFFNLAIAMHIHPILELRELKPKTKRFI